MKILKQVSLLLSLLIATYTNAQKWGDYTLITIDNSTKSLLVDTNGNTVHTIQCPSGSAAYSSYLTKGGYLYRSIKVSNNAFSNGGSTGGFQKWDWHGNLLWEYKISNATEQMHHDIHVMPNGNVLAIVWNVRTAAELTAAGNTTPHVSNPDKIVEIQQNGPTTGTVVWQWDAFDHVCQSTDASKPNYYSNVNLAPHKLNINYKNGTNNKDWLHLNGLDFNPTLNQIVVSSHNISEFYIIDHSTTTAEAATGVGGIYGKGGDFLYRWGNPLAYNVAGATASFKTVHDAHWVPTNCPRAGYLSAFNNNGASNTQSAVDIINVAQTNGVYTQPAAGASFLPSTHDKRIMCNGNSSNKSNGQQLPNGNTLYCLAVPSGRVYEVDSNGFTLWVYNANGSMSHAYRYNACEISPYGQVSANITNNNGVLTASPAIYYQWYKDGVAISGAKSASYTPASFTGVYQVITKDSFLCASTISNGIGNFDTDVQDVEKGKIVISPNPFDNTIEIIGDVLNTDHYSTQIYNLNGALVYSSKNENKLAVGFLSAGYYVLKVQLQNGQIHQQLISKK